jgi:hypothetical protein
MPAKWIDIGIFYVQFEGVKSLANIDDRAWWIEYYRWSITSPTTIKNDTAQTMCCFSRPMSAKGCS